MRVPYVVGRWVRGANHYGRQRLIEYLLSMEDNTVWVVGTRRIGKTSLLRQIEYLTVDDQAYVPLFWDLQGCETSDHLSEELLYAIEDVLERFEPFGVTLADLSSRDAIGMLRHLNRCLAAHNRQLLLLIDEAEALIGIGEREGSWLARLRKTFQHSEQRTIITATKLLSRLNELNSTWTTSPFLFGFRLVNLWSLNVQASADLVRQVQANTEISVDSETHEDILLFTNRHPYLMQYLCQRLFVSEGDLSGSLRPIVESDLFPDQLLGGFFHIDFQHLSALERRILLVIAELGVTTEQTLFEQLNDQPTSRIRTFLYGMSRLSYIREVGEHWTVGNELLRRWLQEHIDELANESPSSVSDSRIEELVQEGAGQEFAFRQQESSQLREALHALERRWSHESDAHVQRDLQREMAEIRRRLHTAETELASIGTRFGDGAGERTKS